MDDSQVITKCLQLSRSACYKFYGISQRTWENVRQTGLLHAEKRGRPIDKLLSAMILDAVKESPEASMDKLTYQIGCSKWKVHRVLTENNLSRLWQRLDYAGVELKELHPDLQRARQRYKEGGIQVDGPGALVHIDTKRFGSLKGGLLLIGHTIVDNFSGFCWIYFAEDCQKSGENTVKAINLYREHFPAGVRTLYHDNGSEFNNEVVAAYCAVNDIADKKTQIAHPWSNGKAERANAMLKREVIVPTLSELRFETPADLQNIVNQRMMWYNYDRPHFGHTNKGLPPAIVAEACIGLTAEQREEALIHLREGIRFKNRSQWERTQ